MIPELEDLGNTNPVKLGRCFDFLQNWYGIQHGNNRFCKTPNNSDSITQKQLAESYHISVDTIENARQGRRLYSLFLDKKDKFDSYFELLSLC